MTMNVMLHRLLQHTQNAVKATQVLLSKACFTCKLLCSTDKYKAD